MATAVKKTEVPVSANEECVTRGGAWENKVKIRLPKKHDGSSNFEIVSVNGRVFKIQCGVEVEVPEPIADMIQNSYDAEESAEAYIEGLSK